MDVGCEALGAGTSRSDRPLAAANGRKPHAGQPSGTVHVLDAVALESVLKSQRIHNSCQHADVIGLRTIHAFGASGQTAENVAAAHDDCQLHATAHDLGDLIGQIVDHLRIDAIAHITRQRFSRQLEQHALVPAVF